MQTLLTTPESIADQKMIAQQVFETMVAIELTPCETHTPGVEKEAVSSILRYSEPSEGAMLIDCSPNLAFDFTGRLMSIPVPSSLDEDVVDAMGELVNMIGGNLKGLMPENTRISPPQVLEPGERERFVAGYRQVSRVCFSSGSEHFCMSLVEPIEEFVAFNESSQESK